MKNKRIAALVSFFCLITLLSVKSEVFSVKAVEENGVLVGISGYEVTISGNVGKSFIDNTMTLKMTEKEQDKIVHLDSFGCMTDGSFNKSFRLPEGTADGVYNLAVGMYGSSDKLYDFNIYFTSPENADSGESAFKWCDVSKIGTVYPDGCTFSVYLKDWENNGRIEYSINNKGKIQAKAAGKYTYINLPDIKNGNHSIEVSASVNGEIKLHQNESFTVMRGYSHQFMDEFNVRGAVTHYAHYTMRDIDADFMDFAGIKTIRDGIKWSIVETNNGFDWGFNDSWINQTGSHNIDMTTIFGFNNYRVHVMYNHYDGEKVDSSNYIPRKQKDIEYYNTYVRKSLERYPQFDKFELWNEPNADTGLAAADYTDLLMNTAVEIKRKHRFADISELSLFGFRENEWTQENFTSGMYPYMTAIAFHPYVQTAADTGSQEKKYEDIYRLIADNGGWKNMNITENGWSTFQNGVSEESAAVNLVKQNILSEKYDLTGSYWYDLVDDGTDVTNREHFFGIITKDRKAKPAYIAYGQLNNMLAGSVYMGEVKADSARIFVYEKDGEPLLLAWVPGGKREHSFNNGISAQDIYGNDVPVMDGAVYLTDSPIYISGADKIWFTYAAQSEISKAAPEWIADYSAILPDALITKAGDIFAADVSMNGEAMEALHNRYKNLGLEILKEGRAGNISEMQTSSALYELYRIMRIVNRMYIVSYDGLDVTSLDSDIDAAVERSNERYYNDFNIMQYSEEILRYAHKFYADAEKVMNCGEENPIKNGVISGWDMMSGALIEWFDEFSSFETAMSYGMLMNIQLDNNAYIDTAEEGKNKETVVYINNKSDGNFSGRLEIYSEKGECLYRSNNLTIDKDSYEYVKTSFLTEKPTEGERGIYTLRLISSEGKVISERNHEIKIYGNEKDEGYPSHEGKGNYGDDNYPRNPDLSARSKESSDESRIFTVAGKRFVLLDKDEDGNYFVAADEAYGQKGFNLVTQSAENTDMLRESGKWKYDVTTDTNIAYWLNNDFLLKGNTNSGVTYKLPNEIISNLVEKEWTLEFAEKAGVEKSYGNVSKVALMSASEWEHYSDRLGYTPYNAPYAYPDKNGNNTYIDGNGNRVNTGWWLRTAYNQEESANLIYGSYITVYRYSTQPGLVAPWSVRSSGQTKYIRPVFWLNSEFFEKNRVDIATCGEKVKDEIGNGDLKLLQNLYSQEELIGLNRVKIGISDDRTRVSVLSPVSLNADIICASYDEKGNLIGVNLNNADIAKGLNEYSVTLPKEFSKGRIFVWESLDKMKPLAESAEFIG